VHENSDQELLSLMQSGDREAFAALYKRHRRGLYGYCRRLLPDTQAAEDAVHETFMKLRSAAIAEPAALTSWLYRVARNECLMTLRRNHDGETRDADAVWDDDTPLLSAERGNIQAFVQDALERLRLEYREVILLREFEGFSYGEIAAVTGDSISSVKSRLFKARRALAGALAGVWKEERENR
jgi:RNA polymerase sigma-70 factor (ECF subfamily)